MQVIPHLNFNGQCEAAFKFYEKCLRGNVAFMLAYGDSPMAAEVAPDWQRRIVHATFAIGGQAVFSGADVPSSQYLKPQGVSITLDVADPVDAERVFKVLSEKGVVQMPIQETFWAHRFAMFTDQFGVPWMINCGKPRP